MSLLRVITRSEFNVFKHLCTRNNNKFKTIYKFPYVQGAGLINRMKLYQTILTSVAVPTATILNQLDVISVDSVMFTCILGIGGIVPLYSFGYFTDKLIGIVYLNEESNLVKIAYLNFWGSRKDIIILKNEIVPFSEMPVSMTDPFYLKVQQFSSKGTMKLCTKYGILDYSGFNKIFFSYIIQNFNV